MSHQVECVMSLLSFLLTRLVWIFAPRLQKRKHNKTNMEASLKKKIVSLFFFSCLLFSHPFAPGCRIRKAKHTLSQSLFLSSSNSSGKVLQVFVVVVVFRFDEGKRRRRRCWYKKAEMVFYMFSNWSTRRLVLPLRISRSVLYLSRPCLTFSLCSLSIAVSFVSSLVPARSFFNIYIESQTDRKRKKSTLS